jgi:hypothetical protein
MSRYLVDRINARPNVNVLIETTVTALEGILEGIRCRSRRSGEELKPAIRLFYLSAPTRTPIGCLAPA